MQVKRKTIGRTLSAAPLPQISNEQEKHSQRFVLKSGKSALFYLEHIPAEELADKTFVRFSVNGRDQNALTPESLVDITRTIKLQQFFPAIGFRQNGKIEILDGSRRRAAALLCNVGLTILVTDLEISSDDARQLASDIQTAKEHNLREIGLRLLQLRDKGMSQKEIALYENLSAAKVTRAIQAASVPEYLVSLFPVQAELSYSDYKFLLKIESLIITKDLQREKIVQDTNERIDALIDKRQITSDELKKVILDVLKDITENFASNKKQNGTIISPLWAFDDKNTYARKRIKDRGFSYEFNRVPKQLQDELDKVITSLMNDFFGKE
ncbi:ParB family chromosome partitioning protein [Providencia alcalifaciens]|uniref:ParB family chromosome partitioning protein n=1 Tax=Providencia alcalifaciens TaxID=126385 RepID=A0A4R3NFQ5_9GAMM|nr:MULTISPECIES: ParB family protein [Providencia]MBC5792384.1 ParB/RepB/Spo0J family partition protein [Providencia sp. JUb39]TCT28820.1 ParB family chromosome partitioning protein [Providencia alcalifaciens]